MNPLASFAKLIDTAGSVAAAVITRDDLYIRPPLARKAVAARFAGGLALLRAFLDRDFPKSLFGQDASLKTRGPRLGQRL